MPAHFIQNAKAYAALIGAICTGLLGVYAADTTVGQVLTILSIVATAVVTWRVPNAETTTVTRGERGASDVWVVVIAGLLLLILLAVLGVLG